MFGIINPPSQYNANTSVGNQMSTMVSNSSDLAAQAATYNMEASTNAVAANWGSSIDLASLPDWSHELVASNVLYTRAFLGQNEEVIEPDGSINLAGNGSPFKLPTDISTVLSTSDDATSSTASDSATSTPSSTSSSASASATGGSTSGAATNVVSTAILGVAAVAGAFLAL